MEAEGATTDANDGNANLPARKAEQSAHDERKRIERLVAGRLFFVRLPKPAELSTSDSLEADKDEIDSKLRKISDELQPIMAERNRVQALLSETREVIRELKAQIEDKELTLNPYQAEKKAAIQERESQRAGRKEQREAEKKARDDQFRAELNAKQKIKNDFNSQYGHLGVANSSEIDEQVRLLEFRQQHESLSINEEKALLKQIKQLQDSREAVTAYSQWAAQDKADRDAKQAFKKQQAAESEATRNNREKPVPENNQTDDEIAQHHEMAQLKAEVNSLWEEYKGQLDQRSRQQETETALKQQLDQCFEKRDVLKKEREDTWEKIQAHRGKVRAANKPYSDNRSFSNNVRDLVKKGSLEEARKLCQEQTAELMGRYAADPEFRSEYNKLWDSAVEYKRPAVSTSESHHKAAASVIAEALEAARRSVASKSGKAKEAETKSVDARPSQGKEASANDLTPAPYSISKPQIPGLDSGMSRSKPKKEKKQKQSPVELPKLDDTEFVPPPIVLKSNIGPSAEELKAQDIAHNKAAAAEAALRKEKRRLTQEKKRQQKLQRADTQSKGLVKEEAAAEEISRPETPPNEDFAAKGSSDAEAVPPKTDKPKARSNRALNSSAARAALAPKSRPYIRRRGILPVLKGYARTAYSSAEERPVLAGVVAAAAIVLTIAPVIYHFS